MAGESAASDVAGDDVDDAAGVAAPADLLGVAGGSGGAGVSDSSDSVEIGVVTVAAHVREPCGVWQVNHAKPTTPLQ
jgi:hypothetical protein